MRTGSTVVSLVSGILAIIGGVLIINSGYHTHSFLITVLNLAELHFGAKLPGDLQWITSFSITILGAVIALGGILVVLGGVVVILRHKLVARILIGLGGGVSFLGIAIALGFAIYTSGFGTLASHFEYWMGVLVATIAGYVARKS